MSWTTRDNLDEEALKRVAAVWAAWKQPESWTVTECLTTLDAEGGYWVIETDEPASITALTETFSLWIKSTVTPVLDVNEGLAAAEAAMTFRDSVS